MLQHNNKTTNVIVTASASSMLMLNEVGKSPFFVLEVTVTEHRESIWST